MRKKDFVGSLALAASALLTPIAAYAQSSPIAANTLPGEAVAAKEVSFSPGGEIRPAASRTETMFPVLNLLLSATPADRITRKTSVNGPAPGNIRIESGAIGGGRVHEEYGYVLSCGPEKKNLIVGKVSDDSVIGPTSGIQISGNRITLDRAETPNPVPVKEYRRFQNPLSKRVNIETYDLANGASSAEDCVRSASGKPDNCLVKSPSLSEDMVGQLHRAAAMVNYMCENKPVDTRVLTGQEKKRQHSIVNALFKAMHDTEKFFAKANQIYLTLTADRPVAVVASALPEAATR